MAGEIIVESIRERKFNLIFLLPITTPLVDKDSNVIVPTPSTGLPANVLDVLTSDEIADLNDGSYVWERAKFVADVAMTQGQILSKVQAVYAGRAAAIQDEYEIEYEFAQYVSTRHDAPSV